MPRIGARLGSSRCGGYGVALGIAPRTEDLIRENLNNLIITTVMMAATTVAARMFRFIHCYGNITIADGRDGAGNSFAPCNALPKGSRPKAAFCVLIKIKGGNKMLKGYTFKIVLLDTNDEVRLSRIFCAETARKAADMVAEFLASIGVDDRYQLECEQEEL